MARARTETAIGAPQAPATDEPEVALARMESRIDWVLARHDISPWLRQAIVTASSADPVSIANDIEMLRHLFVPLAGAWTRNLLDGSQELQRRHADPALSERNC